MKTDNCPLELMDALEELIDQHGITKVLEKLRTACFEKSSHVKSNWQDEELTKFWDKAGCAVNKAVLEVEKLQRYKGYRL